MRKLFLLFCVGAAIGAFIALRNSQPPVQR